VYAGIVRECLFLAPFVTESKEHAGTPHQIMETFILELLKLSPAVAILLFLNVRQDRRVEKLVNALIDCFKDCEDRIDPDDSQRQE
jgi:hypothetical protein